MIKLKPKMTLNKQYEVGSKLKNTTVTVLSIRKGKALLSDMTTVPAVWGESKCVVFDKATFNLYTYSI